MDYISVDVYQIIYLNENLIMFVNLFYMIINPLK